MTDMPNFWWCPTHHLYRGGAERPCADAVKLGDVDALREQLEKTTRQRDSLARRCAKYFETQQKLEGDLAESDESFEQAMAQLKSYTAKLKEARSERDALRAEIGAVLDHPVMPSSEKIGAISVILDAIVDREPACAATPPDSETEWGCRDRHGRVHSVGVENETQARAMLSMTPVRREVGPWIEVPRG